jgi:hypothetical protein
MKALCLVFLALVSSVDLASAQNAAWIAVSAITADRAPLAPDLSLHTANLVNAELKKLGVAAGNVPAPKTPVTAENFEKRLIGTQWLYFGKETITFLEGGKAQWKDNPVLWSWSVKNAGSRIVEGENANRNTKWKFTFDRNLQTGKLEGDGKRIIQRVK